MRLFSRRCAVGILFAALSLSTAASADDYPTRSITLIVPFPPGGGVDAMARVLAQKLSAALKQQVIVENRGGAGGVIGTRAVARAQPDGYTLLLGHTPTVSINPLLYANAGYDGTKDFSPIGLVASMPLALLAHPSFKVKTLAEFISVAKAQPGKLNMGASAVGTGSYMCAELFKAAAGIDVALVTYNGTAPVINDLLGGHVPIAFGVLPPAIGNVAAGNLNAIAVTGLRRTSLLPDVPTVAESGYPGFEAVLNYGLLAPAGTPRPIIDRLNAEIRKIVDTDEVKARVHAEGGDPATSSPDEYASAIAKDKEKWGALIQKLGLKME
jgi:tripartite-type tricarboxylate transporter receptor subunit TctC